MQVYITSINFNYGDYADGFNDVTFKFTTTGLSYTLSGDLVVSKAEYLDKSGSMEDLRKLVKSKIVTDLGGVLAE